MSLVPCNTQIRTLPEVPSAHRAKASTEIEHRKIIQELYNNWSGYILKGNYFFKQSYEKKCQHLNLSKYL